MIGAAEVRQQTAAATDQLQQTAPRGMVVLVGAQVVNDLVDAFRQQGNLYL